MTPARRLRDRLASPELMLLPGVPDAIPARLVEQVGFDAVYATGAGFANAGFGRPDVGLVTLTEVVEHVRRICSVVDLPVIVDADTGYGGVLNVWRTVHELEAVGAAGIQLEDQSIPKRCGHFAGNSVVSTADMVARISAALDARTDPDLVIIARTDAYQSEGLVGAVSRARAYREAGADLLFVEAPTKPEDLDQLPSLVDAPLIINMVEGGLTPWRTSAQLQEAGFRVALYANTTLRVSVNAAKNALEVLRSHGDTAPLWDQMLSWEDRQSIVGLAELQELETRLLNGGSAPTDVEA
jgi:2,3-dimethylmalate lyase